MSKNIVTFEVEVGSVVFHYALCWALASQSRLDSFRGQILEKATTPVSVFSLIPVFICLGFLCCCCFFFILFVILYFDCSALSVPLQVTDWKDSFPK